MVGVLVLVDEDVAEAVLVFGQDVWLSLQQADSLEQDVIKVHAVSPLEFILVQAVNLGNLAGPVVTA